MKYGTWNVAGYDPGAALGLQEAGFSPLTAAVLCSRGLGNPDQAATFLRADGPLLDPFLMGGMDAAVARVKKALDGQEKIAVFGDYDVDGITATCLMSEFLRSCGADCVSYIPGRIEEGYGLSRPAIENLAAQGVSLIITVDCGITAMEEAIFCREIGVDLVITDHHECKGELPEAAAVVDPHCPGDPYPHRDLAGVGVAFKLAAAIAGDQAAILERYCDLVCLGSVADVMPLLGENRIFVAAGLRRLAQSPRLGLAALMKECGCDQKALAAGSIGYVLAPRINAAGRMGQVDIAMELFQTDDPARAALLATQLCELNRERQAVESEIYAEAARMLRGVHGPKAIVLAGEGWHQGVVGIVASRLAEEYCCPAFLICLDGSHGKASSRSYGGFNLFGALERLSHLLESFGGHELAAGFTIARESVDVFRENILQLVEAFHRTGQFRAALEIDCEVPASLLTIPNVEALDQLEPCGSGCPRPVLYMADLTVEHLSEVGGGRHLRLRLGSKGVSLGAIFFSTTALRAAICVGDTVEIAFTPQINEFRGARTVQLSLVDIRPALDTRKSSDRERDLYIRHLRGGMVSPVEADQLLPRRPEFVAVWRYLVANAKEGGLLEDCALMSRKISRCAGIPASLMRTKICLDVFAEQGLITLREQGQAIQITLTADGRKVDLDGSRILGRLKQQKAGD